MKITYYGHACFKLDDGEHSVLFDPYADNSVPGLTLSKKIVVDSVYCSHSHDDHNASDLVKSRKMNPWPHDFMTVPHDHDNGAKRGYSAVAFIKIKNTKIVHLGDIGRIPTDDEYKKLSDTNVLMIPVGGFYTIDATEAKQIIDTIHPNLTILMHYKDGNVGYDVLEDIQNIQTIIPNVERYDSSSIEITDQLLSESHIITLKPIQKIQG